jgi:pimeloyl-ACP methyl ester carboxylesterase
MIDDAAGSIDYDECGAGPTLVLVPGSCSTGAAWRPVISAWNERFRCVTTSLLGYGGTAERRSPQDPAIAREADIVEVVMRKAGGPVHLVGHSLRRPGGAGGGAARARRSEEIAEAAAVELLREYNEDGHYRAFRELSQAYFADFAAGNRNAIARMIDFYGGPGTFASWPSRVRAYAMETTPINILDWATAYGFAPPLASLAASAIPALVIWGSASHPAMQRINVLLSQCVTGAVPAVIAGASHFMLSSHASEVARLIADHVDNAEAATSARSPAPL